MKAAIHKKYGPPEVVAIMDVPKPTPKSDEVLVQVYTSTVNRTDSGFRSAEYFISRFWSGLFRPNYQTLGCEFAGIVEAVGSEVTHFKQGDKVFGFDDVTFGGHAEYLCISENKAIEFIPDNLSFDQAAPLSEGAHYAWSNIKASKIESGQKVMVYGATGAIGSAAVQILKYMGVTVTAVCNTKNVELIKMLGADTVIDYQTQDYKQTNESFDFIFDAVGKSSFDECKHLLTDKGIYVSTELGKNAENVFLALLTPLFKGKKVIFPIPTIDKQVLIFIKKMVAEGKFKPIIDREYSLDQIIEAYKYVETGQKTGNVILKIVD
jgi:NADPH:quinone reductase-like Zn-dependent oxidoreductase